MNVNGCVKITHSRAIKPKDKAMKAFTDWCRTGIMQTIMSNGMVVKVVLADRKWRHFLARISINLRNPHRDDLTSHSTIIRFWQ